MGDAKTRNGTEPTRNIPQDAKTRNEHQRGIFRKMLKRGTSTFTHF